MNIVIKDFLSTTELKEFQESEKNNMWFGSTVTFSKIYEKLLQKNKDIHFIKDLKSFNKLLQSDINLKGGIKIDDDIIFPCYIDLKENIFIYTYTKEFVQGYIKEPIIRYFQIKENIEKSFFFKNTTYHVTLGNQLNKGERHTPLFYIQIFRNQILENKSSENQGIFSLEDGNKVNSSKEIFKNYPIDKLTSICQLISESSSWTYSGKFGGIRENPKDNWIDFQNKKGEIFQVTYNGEKKKCSLMFMDCDSNEKLIPEEIKTTISNFYETGDFSIINRKLDEIKTKLSTEKNSWIMEFDVDGNGEVDLVEGNDFDLLLKKYQKQIIEIDRNYIKQLVSVSELIKSKKKNIQSIFEKIKLSIHRDDLSMFIGVLKNEIHSYQMILLNSLRMITSLIEDDMITFYQIYKVFDKLNIFNSNWENQVSEKLIDIGEELSDLIHSVNKIGTGIIEGLNDLNTLTEESNKNVVHHLREIDSSVKFNNLLTGIQTYQMYKINKNTKSLRG